MAWNRSRAKYGNRKVALDGITFDSKKEAQRYTELKLLEKAGKITGLQLQREFELIPAQREHTNEIYEKGPNKGRFKPGKVIEQKCSYKADLELSRSLQGMLWSSWAMRSQNIAEPWKRLRQAQVRSF